MVEFININGRQIGKGYPPYIVAEISANHNGRLSHAIELIEKAKEAGADAVKLQTYTPDTITLNHRGPDFIIQSGLWKGQTLYDLYQKAHTPWEWHGELISHAREIGLTVFSSPFDETAVDFLETFDVPAYKIASPEIVDFNLIRKCAQTGKPLIISTGMATIEEINEALSIAKQSGAKEIVLLHCVSAYPTPVEESNLSTISFLSEKFDIPIGLSDHTSDSLTTIVSVGLGAALIEKHITLSRKNNGLDDAFSLEPSEFKELTASAQLAFSALGNLEVKLSKTEKEMLFARRSLYVVADIQKGEVFTKQNIRSIRPNYGVHPKFLTSIIGKPARRALCKGEPFNLNMIKNDKPKK
ncbi:MAG: pseudaminic acid synthase [Pseudomonadota bacterium]|nr:pseudaminic acid synthase [Pseudomonadota bacterium]